MKDAISHLGFARGATTLDECALAELEELFTLLPAGKPGCRIDPMIAERSRAVQIAMIGAVSLIGEGARPVRALLFDKCDEANWSLGWHQDRTIEVAAAVEVPGYRPYTVKQGRLHVAPPIELVEEMRTVRIHLDPVDDDNAPLVIAPGSHRMGFVPECAIDDIVARCGETICTAERGAMWFYATPILHRSARAMGERRRRVLQLDFASCRLPGGLEWARDVTTA